MSIFTARFNLWCAWCGSAKHNKNTCPDLNPWGNHCHFCGSSGHSSKRCPDKVFNVKEQDLKEMQEKGEFDGVDLTN